MLKRRSLVAGLAGATVLASNGGRAQEAWPTRPVKIVVPWPPGGGVDAFARVIQAPLSARLGQTVVIENIGGGAGRVGTQTAARAPADGYNFVLVNDTFAATEALPIPGATPLLPALAPVTFAISGPQGLFTHPRSGLASVKDFVAAAKAKPGKLNIGVPGLGSSQHLTSELLLRAAGDLSVTHVPYRGGGPLLLELIAGNIDAGVVTFAAGIPQAKGGQLVALAVTSDKRSAAYRDVPTASETIAPGFVQTTWQGFLAPKATSADVRSRFHAALVAVLKEPAVIERLEQLGFEPAGLDGVAFAKLFDQTVDTFAGIARERNIAAGD